MLQFIDDYYDNDGEDKFDMTAFFAEILSNESEVAKDTRTRQNPQPFPASQSRPQQYVDPLAVALANISQAR
ncbi:hypothetical protein G6F56_004394 [Rhizopus delemar]|nr:hypothetical protein G6F56_004394 [Rhizopus delemar]